MSFHPGPGLLREECARVPPAPRVPGSAPRSSSATCLGPCRLSVSLTGFQASPGSDGSRFSFGPRGWGWSGPAPQTSAPLPVVTCPNSYGLGRTSRRPARGSATGAARENWRPSLRASTGSTGPALRAPSRTGPTSCPPPASSSCPAQARGVSLRRAEGALGRERRAAGSLEQGTGGLTAERRIREGAAAWTWRGSWGAAGTLRAGLRRAEGHRGGGRLGEGAGARSGPRGSSGTDAERRASLGAWRGSLETRLLAGQLRQDWF